MRRFLYRHVLIPAFETGIKWRKTFRYWKELERSQWLGREELERIQFAALHRLVSHAFANCPYYQKEWSKRGLRPQSLKTLEDFGSWPIIGRETVRENRLRMRMASSGKRLFPKSTGGSSGVPLYFDLDMNSYAWKLATWYRGYDWANAAPGTKQLWLWGVPLGPQPWWKPFKDRLYQRFYRRFVLNCFHLNEETFHRYLHQLNRYKPDVIVAYTNALYVFAQFLDGENLKVFRPKSIVLGAEKVHDFQRQLIERVFGCQVYETYGSREFTFIAGECDRHRGLHLSIETLLVEVVDDYGRPVPEGEEGNIVITDLTNYGMPFVRYANDDRAVAGWKKCSCGRGLPLLRKVVGRRLDILQTPDGRKIPGEFFPHLMKDFPAVKRFQVVQEDLNHIQLRVVLKNAWNEGDRKFLDHEIRKVLGQAIRFDLLPVDDIPLTRAGKLQVVLNLHSSNGSAVSP